MLCPSCTRDNPPEAQFCMSCATELASAEPLASASTSTTQAIDLSPVFVGRQLEMGELKAALEDALSGRGRTAGSDNDAGTDLSNTRPAPVSCLSDRADVLIARGDETWIFLAQRKISRLNG